MTEQNYGRHPETHEASPIEPSLDTAWFLGAVIGKGSVKTSGSNGAIALTGPSEQVLQKFRIIGERIIGTPPRDSRKRESSNPTVSFFNKRYANALGDLRKDSWPDTVDTQHAWLYEDDQYLWKFVEGLLDTRGRLDIKGKQKSITISASQLSVVDKLTDIFSRLGINRTSILNSSFTQEGVQGVAIYNKDDFKTIAEHVSLVDPEKQATLDTAKTFRQGRQVAALPREEIIAEWDRLTKMFGRPPTADEIARLRSEEPPRTRFSASTYINYFGAAEPEGHTTWIQARETLSGLVPDPNPKEATEVFSPKPQTKKDQLVAHMQSELERGAQGHKPKVGSDLELAEMFGIHVQNVRAFLREAGLGEEWRTLRKQHEVPTRKEHLPREAVIAEWVRLTEVLGPNPTSSAIARLRSEDPPGTPFSVGTYVNYFGQDPSGEKASFVRARRVLNSLISEANPDTAN